MSRQRVDNDELTVQRSQSATGQKVGDITDLILIGNPGPTERRMEIRPGSRHPDTSSFPAFSFSDSQSTTSPSGATVRIQLSGG
jgi:hypothetical protein